MCTLSWWIADSERGVLFNRDELRTRRRGSAPSIRPSETAFDVLCPTDPDAGGSWIGVNDRGLIVALLNNYAQEDAYIPSDIRSRGTLVVELLQGAATAKECLHQLSVESCRSYRPFVIFVMGPACEPLAIEWSGSQTNTIDLDHRRGLHMLTSSSYSEARCREYREELFRNVPPERSTIRENHLHYHRDESALGPLMVRDDAATDSITEIVLDAGVAHMWFESVERASPKSVVANKGAPELSPASYYTLKVNEVR